MSSPKPENNETPDWSIGREGELLTKLMYQHEHEYPSAFFKTPKQNLDIAWENDFSLVDAYQCLEDDHIDYEEQILRDLTVDYRVSLESKKIQMLGYVGQACLIMKPNEEKIMELHYSEKCKLLAKALMKVAEDYEEQEEAELYPMTSGIPNWKEKVGYKKDEELDAMIGTMRELVDQKWKNRTEEFYDYAYVDPDEEEEEEEKKEEILAEIKKLKSRFNELN
jgi:hypothetical protein